MNKKRSKLSVELGIGNLKMILSYLIATVLIVILFSYIGYQWDTSIRTEAIDVSEINDTYKLEDVFRKLDLPDGSYVEVIDTDYTIVNAYNSPQQVGYTYTPELLLQYKMDDYSGGRDYYALSQKSNGQLVLVYLSSVEAFLGQPPYIELTILFVVVLVLVTASIISIYVRKLSKLIIRPIEHLTGGITKITGGDYIRITPFGVNNELEILRESINTMSQTIRRETQLREKSESDRKQLILNVSHDLKTPLTNISGYSQTLRTHLKNRDEETKQFLDIIISNGNKANGLITELFELSQMDDERNSFHLIEDNICDFVRDIIVEYMPELDSKNIQYDFNIPDERLIVDFCQYNLGRAFSNLMDNAIKYVGPGAMIKVHIRAIEDFVELVIEDNGQGIPDDLSEDIFNAFVRVDSSRDTSTGGSGLGLAITKSIIERHRGSIQLDNHYKEGARFIIRLPLIKIM